MFLKGYLIFWTDEKSKSNTKNVFYPAEKFDTLFYYVIFEDAFWSVGSGSFQSAVYCLMEKEGIFKKQLILTECDGAVAQARVFFLFAYRDVLIVFVIAGARVSVLFSAFSVQKILFII